MNKLKALINRVLDALRRLQWKLTLAYTLSTVVTVVILGAIGLGLLWYINFRSNLLPTAIASSLARMTPSPARYLEETPIDRAALADWLQSVTPGNYLTLNILREDTEERGDTAPAQLGRVKLVFVVDDQGRLLAVTPAEDLAVGMRPESGLSAYERDLLQASLQGETEPSQLSGRNAEGDMVAAGPLLGENEQMVGAIFVRVTYPFEESEFVQGALQGAIFPLAVGMLVAGVAAGVIFGLLIARNLTRRLNVLAEAADVWSRGDFSVAVRDSSGDELGHLAQHLNSMAEQLQSLFQTRQELATLEERNRLARDLHDSVKQQVFATAMQVGTARALLERDPEAARSHLAEAEHLVGQAQQELTGLIQELRPAALEGKGLATALREYAADWSRQSNIVVDVRVQGERPLPLPLEQAFFRVAQEALTNAGRHSQATAVEVGLAWQNGRVTLSVSDNGQGFVPDQAAGKGLGLRSMRERIEGVGGRLAIESAPGQGARVTAHSPVAME